MHNTSSGLEFSDAIAVQPGGLSPSDEKVTLSDLLSTRRVGFVDCFDTR